MDAERHECLLSKIMFSKSKSVEGSPWSVVWSFVRGQALLKSNYKKDQKMIGTYMGRPYLIFVTGTTGGACVKKIAWCKFLQI